MTWKLFTVIMAALLIFIGGFQTKTLLDQRVTSYSAFGDSTANSNLQTKPPHPSTSRLPFVEGRSPNIGDDGYLFEGTQMWATEFKVRVVTYPNLSALRARFNQPSNSTLIAMTMSPTPGDKNTCTINIVDPRALYWPQYIGHEFVHCMVGNFHPEQDYWGKVDATK